MPESGGVMKKIVCLLLLVLGMGLGFAQEGNRVPRFQVGLDSLTIAWPTANAKGGVTSSFGLNLGLGVTYRSYFEPLHPGRGAFYWEAGTMVLVLPYLGVGYSFRINESLYVGAGLNAYSALLLAGTFPIYPSIHLGVYFY